MASKKAVAAQNGQRVGLKPSECECKRREAITKAHFFDHASRQRLEESQCCGDATWPQGLIIQFRASEADGIYENRWYGPYDTLLRHCFDYSFDYIVEAQAPSTRDTREPDDFITYMIVINEKRKPVLVLEIKNEAWRESPTRRRDADTQIRKRLDDLQAECPNPVLFGISAMGTYVRFYRLYRQTATIEPEEEALPQTNRVTPASYLSGQWDCNVLEQEGFDAMKAIIAEIKSRGRGQ